ncbi:glycosyltransferase family 8 protein [Daldinia bambusicola]|nr:glycosyltransferase family 8 protein [Daldinia bambusicola]
MNIASDSEMSKKYAYATLITRESYLAGVLILSETLKRHSTAYPLVVLFTPNLSKDAIKILDALHLRNNIVLRQCDHLLPPGDIKIKLIAERFEDTWTKLRVFELFEYDAVCCLDADMAVFHNMDPIFDKLDLLEEDWLGTNHACICNWDNDPWAPEDWCSENCAYTPQSHPSALYEPTQPEKGAPRTHHMINSGMFLFRPSKALWKAMIEFFNTTDLLSSFLFPDQDFLAHFFSGRWRALGWQYNAFKTMRYWHPNIWRDEEVVCLHFIVDKPWAKRIDKDGVGGYKGRDGITHSWWWDEWRLFLKSLEIERGFDPHIDREFLNLIANSVAPPLESESTRRGSDAFETGLHLRIDL